MWSFLFNPTVDSITSGLRKQVRKLRELAADHHATADEHEQVAAHVVESAAAYRAEAIRADHIASNFESLLSPPVAEPQA